MTTTDLAAPRAPTLQEEPTGLTPLTTGPVTDLRVAGQLTGRSLPDCRRAIDGLVDQGVRRLVLDLRRTSVDRDGLALLILMRRYAYRRGIRLTVRNAPRLVTRTLARAHLSPLYGLVPEHGLIPDHPLGQPPIAGGDGS